MSSFKNVYRGLLEAIENKNKVVITESELSDETAKKFKVVQFAKSIDSELSYHTKLFKKSAISFVKVVFELNGKKAESKEIPIPSLPKKDEIKESIEEIAKSICVAIGRVVDDEIGFDPDNMILVDGWAVSLDEDEEIEESFLFEKIVKAIVKGKNIDFPIEVDVTDYEDEDQSDRVTIGKMSLVIREA